MTRKGKAGRPKAERATDIRIIFRCFSEDRKAIQDAARRLRLTQSEIIRRALRCGLRVLSRVEIPGSE